MRRKIVLIGITLALLLGGVKTSVAQAQNVVYRGASLVDVGLGVSSGALPISFAYEYGIADNLWDANSALTLGGRGAILLANDYGGFFIGPRLALHYHFIPQLDTYASLMLGYLHSTVNTGAEIEIGGTKIKARNVRASAGGFDWGVHIGARYYFTPKVGAFAELGYGYSYLNLGVSFRL